jgi:hypothetical protein
MITAELLETFQLPPSPHEQDMGAVEPFTGAELAAIGRYNEATAGITDCLAAVVIDDGAGIFTGHEAEFGRDCTIAYVKEHFGWLHSWFAALDTLDADLRACSPYSALSNAADRLMTYEARALIYGRDQVRYAALRYLIGDAGPGPEAAGSYVLFSNGFVLI